MGDFMNIINFEKITIDRKYIIGRLSKSRRSSKQPSDKLNGKIDDMLKVAQDIMDPRGIFKIFELNDLPDKPYFENALMVGFAICTIGEKLPNQIKTYLDNGELVKGVILDAIGSVAADAVADSIDKLIQSESEELKLIPSMRYSPGYCDAPLSDQTLIFNKLQEETDQKIGVELTPLFMMKPVKSVSFVVNLGISFVNRCKTCTIKNCPHRR